MIILALYLKIEHHVLHPFIKDWIQNKTIYNLRLVHKILIPKSFNVYERLQLLCLNVQTIFNNAYTDTDTDIDIFLCYS